MGLARINFCCSPYSCCQTLNVFIVDTTTHSCTPVRVVVAVGAGAERSSSPQRGGLPVVLVVAGNTQHCTGHDKETPELPEAVHLDVRHAVVLLPVDLHWLRALPSLLLQQPLQLPELPVPRPLRPGDSAPLLRTGATPPQLSESLLHQASAQRKLSDPDRNIPASSPGRA